MAPKPQKKNPRASSASGSGSSSSLSSKPPRKEKKEFPKFSIDEITEMTNHFGDLHGSGKYAQVFKGELDSEEIAVKVYQNDKENLAKNEMDALSILGCYPHIIPFKGACIHDEYYIVMKFVPRNLEQVLEASELNWEETHKILKQIAYAIQAIINEDYVVADIKPNNILIDENYQVYLCDFGSAKRGGHQLPTFNKSYSPKEVVSSGNGTIESDIYSFGVILLQMIMKYNDFEEREYKNSIAQEVQSVQMAVHGKKNKKAANSSRRRKPHVVIQARIDMSTYKDGHGHVVEKRLIHSGCNENDAEKITQLGLKCSRDEPNQRPSISILEELKVKKMKP